MSVHLWALGASEEQPPRRVRLALAEVALVVGARPGVAERRLVVDAGAREVHHAGAVVAAENVATGPAKLIKKQFALVCETLRAVGVNPNPNPRVHFAALL